MPRANLNKERIFEAAARLANERGFAALSLKDIGAHFGVKPPSLFKHVRDLGEIRDGVAVLGLTRFRDALATVPDNPATDRLRNACFLYRGIAKDFPGEYQAFQQTHVKRSAAVYTLAEEVLRLLKNLLPESLSAENQIHALRFMRGTLHGFVTLENDSGFGLEENVEISFTRTVDAILFAIPKVFG